MDVIISKKQFDEFDIPTEDIEFVKAWKEKTGHYPKFRELQQSSRQDENKNIVPTKVGDIVPNHPRKNITTKSYVDLYLGKYLKLIIAKLDTTDPHVRGALGSRNYVTIDKKQVLRSELETLTYNIFVLENLVNEIEVDSKRFLSTCNKQPDFVWEKRKIIIEVAGMESEEYKSKLSDAEECFKNLGYTVYIINVRPFEKQGKYISYYLYLCNLLGFKPKDEVINSPYKYLGYKDADREFKQKYIDDNINKLPLTRQESYTLNKYVNQLYGYGINEYKKRNQLKRFRHSVNKGDIIKYKLDNPHLSNREIASHFGVSKNTIQQTTKGLK